MNVDWVLSVPEVEEDVVPLDWAALLSVLCNAVAAL